MDSVLGMEPAGTGMEPTGTGMDPTDTGMEPTDGAPDGHICILVTEQAVFH